MDIFTIIVHTFQKLGVNAYHYLRARLLESTDHPNLATLIQTAASV
jgi:hypothetical protein